MAFAPAALQTLGRELVRQLGGALSGIVGDPAHLYGYHRARNELPRTDYSAKLGPDLLGDGNAASALDWSLDPAQMQLYSDRLAAACDRRDARMRYVREWYGSTTAWLDDGRTHDGKDDSWSRQTSDDTHRWHIHLSFWREYSNSMEAVQAVLSVLKGEEGDDDMSEKSEIQVNLVASNWNPDRAEWVRGRGDAAAWDRVTGGDPNLRINGVKQALDAMALSIEDIKKKQAVAPIDYDKLAVALLKALGK